VKNLTLEQATDGSFRLLGELGFATVPEVLESGRRLFSGGGTLTLDLSGVSRVDSAGLALLVEWVREGRRQGRTLAFTGVPEQLLSIARISGLEEILGLT
jgi:phospholipid transport system transporter-binding protein